MGPGVGWMLRQCGGGAFFPSRSQRGLCGRMAWLFNMTEIHGDCSMPVSRQRYQHEEFRVFFRKSWDQFLTNKGVEPCYL